MNRLKRSPFMEGVFSLSYWYIIKMMAFNLIFDGSLIIFLTLTLIIGATHILPVFVVNWILIILNILALYPLIISFFKSLRERKLSVEFLALSALALSAFYHEWYSMAFINLMITSARMLGNYVSDRGRRSIEMLLKLKPETAHIIRDGEFFNIPVNEIEKKDRVAIFSGEAIPVDGLIIKGEGEFDQSSLTGESGLAYKKTNDKVYAATILVSGNIEVEVIEIGKNTVLEKMIALVESSGKNKAAVLTVVDRFTSFYLIVTGAIALIIWFTVGDLEMILAFMLVVCADDIAVAVPLAFTAAIGNAARRGAIVKGGVFIEKLDKIKKIFVDKTGTLTEGKMAFIGEVIFDKEKMNRAESGIRSMMIKSTHPVSVAIAGHFGKGSAGVDEVFDLKEYGGRGMEGMFGGERLILGRLQYVLSSGCILSDKNKIEVEKIMRSGASAMFVGFGNEIIGVYLLSDKLREGAGGVISAMRSDGKEIVMLTGDNESVAQKIALQANISDFRANLLPEDKVRFITEASKKEVVGMVGDGVNDAAALAAASVGIAMGGIGSDISIETSDIVLMKDEIKDLPELIKLSRETMKVVRQNFIIWLIVNVFGMTLVFTRTISPSGAAAYNFVTDFFPLVNSLRLFGGRDYFMIIKNRVKLRRS